VVWICQNHAYFHSKTQKKVSYKVQKIEYYLKKSISKSVIVATFEAIFDYRIDNMILKRRGYVKIMHIFILKYRKKCIIKFKIWVLSQKVSQKVMIVATFEAIFDYRIENMILNTHEQFKIMHIFILKHKKKMWSGVLI